MENKIRRFAIPNACYLGNNHYGNKESYAPWVDTVTYNKTANSGKDTAFSLVTIDLDSGMCYVDNYGAGIDRVFSTNYASDIAVPQSISNISYDGITTVGEQIDNSLISYTVNYSDGTKSEKTGGVSINPATIIATGANTYTVTYTEGSNSVTGTLVITGTKTFYSVTNNLTNCTNSNTATRVDHGIAYSATITANEGYEISSITAKMGSTTLSVVDNTINIASVTNDIVITATATAVEVPEPAGRLLNLDRTYVTGTTGENLKDNLDASKAYLNVNRTATEVFHEKSCSVSNVTEDSVTVTESGIGGIVVAYPIYLPGISNSSYRVTFDYSGSGKCRSYYRYYTSAGVSSGNANLFIDDTTGGTGSADVTIPASTGFDWLVNYLTSNTGNTKTFSNVMLTKA